MKNLIDLEDVFISKYDDAKSMSSTLVPLLVELQEIKSDRYKESIKACRKALLENKEKYNNLKRQLPAITFCGTFNGPHKKESLANYNSLLILDIDYLNLNQEELEAIKALIFEDDHVFACWASPSGKGIKCLLFTDSVAETHKVYFDEAVNYFNEKFKITVDKTGSDICRLCFISYDPEILIKNKEFKIFKVDPEKIITVSTQELKAKEIKSPKEFVSKIVISQRSLFYDTRNRNNKNNRATLDKIIRFLTKNGFSITSTYEDWFRVALAIANSFTYDLGEKLFLKLCRLDGANHDEYKSKYILDYCYRNRRIGAIKFSTIIHFAKAKGFEVKSGRRKLDEELLP